MASGFFPLSRHSDDGKKLLQAADTVDSIASEYYECAQELTESDNAAYDGASVARLWLAAEMIRRELERTPEQVAAERVRGAAQDMLEALEGAQEAVCSLTCPSVKGVGEEWTHSPQCLAISAALAKARGEEVRP